MNTSGRTEAVVPGTGAAVSAFGHGTAFNNPVANAGKMAGRNSRQTLP
jgi:hypothetical protein